MDHATITTLIALGLAFLAAALAQLSRQWLAPRPARRARLLAACLGAGLAALTTDALLLEWHDPSASLLVAVGTVVGWVGPSVLSRLGQLIEGKYGLRPHDDC